MGSSHLICSFIGVALLLWKLPGFSAASRINVALSSKAIQSSLRSYREKAENAIDGNSDPDFRHQNCSTTDYQANPWWRLELPGVYRVSEIQVTNSKYHRKYSRERLDGIGIHIGNSLGNNGTDNPRCAIIIEDPDCLTQTVKCWGMEGRFIHFYKSSDRLTYLGLCEVKVYGEPAAPSMSLQEMGRNITLVGTRLCWSDALLYCRDSHWDLLSLMGPEDQEMVDELVAHTTFNLTSHLWVGLRRTRSGSSWFWMSGDPMNFTQWDEGYHHPSPCGSVSSREPYTWRQRSCEEHLNFICFTDPTEGSKKLRFYSSTRENQIRCT
ncbi:C-type mannose receptor 2-like [Gadus chalcogrammus]|uniref:C-type mannose receptor 2-like n=1 Tax=Gadus chalcogrammus TaxID=1042646 RepID=UPI0024C3D67F|nr:C-type mannose receptor 2-like [Gadus chalcogrammus]XP_056450641.1 C-type mannose receptor 2-like [Gadus chalcogrammus]